jgi:subtilisin family serine protease
MILHSRVLVTVLGVLSSVWLAACSPEEAAPVVAEPVVTGTVQRLVINKKDDLPRHSYHLDVLATDLYLPENRALLLALAAQLRVDIEADLANYEIKDSSTLQDFYADLGSIAMLEQGWQEYLDLLDQRRQLESKQANKLTMGLEGEGFARAHLAQAEDIEAYVKAFLEQRLAELPYVVVQDNLKRAKGRSEILSQALVLGSIESGVQPVLDKTSGDMSYDIASRLVGTSFTLDYYIQSMPMINQVYAEVIAANKIEKHDIWEARKVVLAADADASAAVISVWDSGVDTRIFTAPSQLWTNPDEIPDNGIDDDGNGFVDDIHGIAWSLHDDKEVPLLFPIGEFPREELVLQQQIKGLGDISSAVDSEEAAQLRRQLAQLQQDQVKDFIESINIYGNYSHGTHVAGIALEGNPFARLLVARMTFGHEIIPEEPTVVKARKNALAMAATIDYFRANGVRAVNMSWGGTLRSIEDALEAHNAGGTPEERKALAREIYSIGNEALRKGISEATEILFITSAGNSDNDVKFDESYPSSYDYPNIMSVGAVDEEGNETSFTSLGKVDVYANGFEVESYVPGGNRIKFNGTSMASPQVLNLAGKLLAKKPDLTTAQLRSHIVDGADTKQLESREIRLMNPQRSMELLEER